MPPNNPMMEGEALAVTARPQDVALLPCPFCGGTDVGHEYVETYSLDSSYETFGCRSCGAVFVDGSAEEWNTRANVTAALASAQAREEELRAEVARLQSEIENKWAEGVHTCGSNCQRPMCVLRRRAERLEEALRELAQQMRRDALGCDRDGYRDPAIVKRDCAARIDAALSTNAATQTGETK